MSAGDEEVLAQHISDFLAVEPDAGPKVLQQHLLALKDANGEPLFLDLDVKHKKVKRIMQALRIARESEHGTTSGNAVPAAKNIATRAEAQRAFELHSSSLSTGPSFISYLGRATALLSLGRPREALSDAKAALKLEPTSLEAFVCKARAHQNLGDFDKALSVIDLAQQQVSAAQSAQGQLRQLKAEIKQHQTMFARAEWRDLEAAPDVGKALAERLKQARQIQRGMQQTSTREDLTSYMRLMPGLQAAGRGHEARDAGKLKEAFSSYKASAEMGCADGMYNLALCYKDGAGCDRSVDQYLKWVRKACLQEPFLGLGIENLGVAGAENSLGVSYRDGVGVDIDAKEARSWFQRSAEHGSVEGMNNFGLMLEDEGKRDYAIQEFRRAAERGYSRAMENLALILSDDPQANSAGKDEASQWLRRAQSLGSSQAFLINALAAAQDFESFGHGSDLDRSISDAVSAVEACPGDPTLSRFCAALLLRRQEEMDDNLTELEAKELLSTLGTDTTSLCRSALLQDVQRHRPFTDDETRAVELLKVAGKSDVQSQKLLASFFEKKGLSRKARKWFERAAESGDADAAYSLCLILQTEDQEGKYSVDSLNRSLHWLEKAVMRGSPEARRNYVSLRDSITNRQLTAKRGSTSNTCLPRATGDGSALASLLSGGHGKLSTKDRDDATRLANALRRSSQPSSSMTVHNFFRESPRVARIEEMEAYIARCQSPSPTAVHLLKALCCFKEALFAIWEGRTNATDWLCEAILWDEKACQYTPAVMSEFASLARERAAEAEPLLDIPALVVICWCCNMDDFQLHVQIYTRIIQALQSGQGVQRWNEWLPRFIELRANGYCFQGCWSEGLREFRCLEELCHGSMFKDSGYSIGVCLTNLGAEGAERAFSRYTHSASSDGFKLPHAYYQLAQFALLREDFAAMKNLLDAAELAEKHRIPLLGPIDNSFPLKEMMISTFRIKSRQQPQRSRATVVCGHCGRSPQRLLPCPCRAVFYCDKECQKAGWKAHKSVCSAKAGGKTKI